MATLAGRKAKSLGVFAQKIISRFPEIPEENDVWEMSVQDLKKEFRGKVGPIYEVLVILESLLLVIKLAKRNYTNTHKIV